VPRFKAVMRWLLGIFFCRQFLCRRTSCQGQQGYDERDDLHDAPAAARLLRIHPNAAEWMSDNYFPSQLLQ
jgi:hypothetical protein